MDQGINPAAVKTWLLGLQQTIVTGLELALKT